MLKKLRISSSTFLHRNWLAWQTLLKTASEYCEHEKKRKECRACPEKLRLGLLTDIDMLLMFEKGIRGSIT